MIKKILALSCLLISVSYSQLLGPKIVFQEKEYDFGTAVQGERVKHNFVVTNNGDDTLKISNVHASCGCTAALPDKKELLPGESTNIKVEFNSTGRTGSQVKYITVNSNDKDNPEFVLKFYGDVVKEDSLKKKDTSTIQKEKSN
jgi:Protein of unknown function (DUF1573)